MNRTEKIQALETRLNNLSKPKEVSMTDQLISEELENLRADLSKRISTRSIEDMRKDMSSFKEGFTLEPVFKALTEAQNKSDRDITSLRKEFDTKVRSIASSIVEETRKGKDFSAKSLEKLAKTLEKVQRIYEEENKGAINRAILFTSEVDRLDQEVRRMSLLFNSLESDESVDYTPIIEEAVTRLEKRMMSRIGSISHGGNMNRNFTLNGASVLTRFTDIDIVPGTNMEILASVDESKGTTKLLFNGTGAGSDIFSSVSGTVNGANTAFGYPSAPEAVIGDGITYFSGNGYSFAASVITMEIPPSSYIKAII